MAAGISEWDSYFQYKSVGFVDSQGLKEQLADAAERVFVGPEEEVEFTVYDIEDGELETSIITDEAKWVTAGGKTPKSGVRIISLYSDRTDAPLKITSRIASRIFRHYHVKRSLVRLLLSFGDEPHVSEASSGNRAFYEDTGVADGYIMQYKLNYVEQDKSPDKSTWSRRHMGIYHHHRFSEKLDIFILVNCTKSTAFYRTLQKLLPPAPSAPTADERLETLERKLGSMLPPTGGTVNENGNGALAKLGGTPESMHPLLVSCYVENWRPYLRHLEHHFSQINSHVTGNDLEKIGQDSFSSMQSLRHTNDLAMFAGACCTNNLDIVTSLMGSGIFDLEPTQSLSAQANELRGHAESIKVLQNRIRNSLEFVGYTMALHGQLDMSKLEKEMSDMTQQIKELAQEAAVLRKKLQELGQHAVADGAVVLAFSRANGMRTFWKRKSRGETSKS